MSEKHEDTQGREPEYDPDVVEAVEAAIGRHMSGPFAQAATPPALRAVAALLRQQAREWSSPDLMDAAAWLDGTL